MNAGPDRRVARRPERRVARPVAGDDRAGTVLTVTEAELEQLGINVVRGLAMDAPQKADSGHPGTAMALAPLAHVLFTRIMRHDPADPRWPDRDRFILSNGHASILLYSFLFLTGYGLTLDDIRQFRQWGSKTPGHPEVHLTDGVEVTTGPLGQGFGNGVGMGIAERWLRARFGPELVDHYTFVICSDGDLMEGISHEAASLAGHLGLGRLVYIYDDNHITIDGPTELAYTDDVAGRFDAYGWHTDNIGEVANDTDALEAALRRAMAVEDRPSMILLRSHIGWPSPHKTDTADAHGNPLGEDEVRETKAILGLPPDEAFWAPDEVVDFYRRCMARGATLNGAWQARLDAWDGDRAVWEACQRGRGLQGWSEKLPTFEVGTSLATRVAVNRCITATAEVIPSLIVGSADLTGNTGVKLQGGVDQSAEHPEGGQIHFGIREHAMGAAMTGMACDGGVLPVGGTFYIFSDYMRPSVRLAALVGYAHLRGRTTRWAWAGTAPPINRSSNWPRCVPLVPAHDPPRGRQRDGPRLAHRGGLRRTDGAGAVAPVDPGSRGHRRGRRGRRPGRLRAGGTRRCPRGRPHRHRLRGLGVHGGGCPSARR